LLTEFVRMIRADGRHNSVREGGGPPPLRLVDKLRNACPALALARRQRTVLRKTLEHTSGGGLEILRDVGRGWWKLCVQRWMDKVEMGERKYIRVSGMRGWVVGEADAGRTVEREDV
jgi:hypothetical protein